MPTPSKFTPERKKEIIANFRKGLSVASSADAVGITRRTLYRWLERGEWETEGIYHDFYLACQNAQETYWEERQTELEAIVIAAATETITTMTTTTTTDAEGAITETVVVKEHRPNARLALEILSRRAPEQWNKVAMLKQQKDARSELVAHGLDPDEIIARVNKVLADAVRKRDKPHETPRLTE